MIHEFPLFGIGQQLRRGIVAHGHIVEVPHEPRAPLHHLVNELVGADGVQILAGVAAGQTEGQVLFLQDCYSLDDLLVSAVATAAVGGGFKALDADGWNEVLHPEHLVCKGFVNESGIGEGEELTVAVLFAKGNQILFTHQRFTAGVDVHIHTHFLALGDNGVNFVEGQVQLVSIFCRPAAGTVQVAGRGGVQQDCPGDIAVVFLSIFLLLGPADDVGVEEEVLKGRLQNTGIGFFQNAHDQLVHIVLGIFQNISDSGTLSGKTIGTLSCQLVHPAHELQGIFFGVLFQITKGCAQRYFFQLIG